VSAPTNTQFAVGVHVLTLLAAAAGEPQSSEQMADSVGSNPVHIRRVLGRLRCAGLVESRPGPGGGWRLCADPSAIRLGDIWHAVQGDEQVLGLHAANPDCPVGREIQARLRAVDRAAAAALTAELDRSTVADVLAGTGLPAGAQLIAVAG
jgi:Rrf2 family protein